MQTILQCRFKLYQFGASLKVGEVLYIPTLIKLLFMNSYANIHYGVLVSLLHTIYKGACAVSAANPHYSSRIKTSIYLLEPTGKESTVL